MLRTTIPAAIALACLAVVETAHAQTAVSGFGNAGQFILSADRLFGLNVWSLKNEPQATPTDMTPGNPTKDSGTGINLLWGGDAGIGSINAPIYSTPRLAFDYVLIPGLTVGGAVGYFHRSSSHETTNMQGVTTSVDRPDGNAIIFSPRAGYIFDFTPLLAVWARGGFTYYWFKSQGTTTNGMASTTSKTSADGLAITLDPQLVITPVPHFGITVGPMFDLPLAGSSKSETTGMVGPVATTITGEANTKITNWGISAGVLGYF
jgi:hypothetical protein